MSASKAVGVKVRKLDPLQLEFLRVAGTEPEWTLLEMMKNQQIGKDRMVRWLDDDVFLGAYMRVRGRAELSMLPGVLREWRKLSLNPKSGAAFGKLWLEGLEKMSRAVAGAGAGVGAGGGSASIAQYGLEAGDVADLGMGDSDAGIGSGGEVAAEDRDADEGRDSSGG